MRKNLLIVGIILLVVGVVLAGVSLVEAAHSTSGGGNTMYTGQNGNFYSKPITATPDDYVVVSSSVQTYLILTKDFNSVNSANIGNYSISPKESTANAFVYTGLNGTYYVVTFGSTTPRVDYAVLGSGLGHLIVSGILLIIGVLVAIVGIIISIIGAVLKPKIVPQRPS